MQNGPLIAAVMALSFALSFFMSGMEAGVFALSLLRIRQWMRAGKLRAKVLHGYLERPEDFLWTILVGNTLANFVAECQGVDAPNPPLSARPSPFRAHFFVRRSFFEPTQRLFLPIPSPIPPHRPCHVQL